MTTYTYPESEERLVLPSAAAAADASTRNAMAFDRAAREHVEQLSAEIAALRATNAELVDVALKTCHAGLQAWQRARHWQRRARQFLVIAKDARDQAIYNDASADYWRDQDDKANTRRNDVLAWLGYWCDRLPAGAIADLRTILNVNTDAETDAEVAYE